MIHKKIVTEKMKEFMVQDFITKNIKRAGLSEVKLQMTPLGEKIIIRTSRPGLVVGKKGMFIKKLTSTIKKTMKLENPQIEIDEVRDIYLDPRIVAEKIANSLERFGPARFKGFGHKALTDVMNAGALGVEIIISGKIPSSRAKRWRFYMGYLKKCGDISQTGVKKAYLTAQLKTGTIGIQVKIMPPDVKLPDNIKLAKELQHEETVADIAPAEAEEVKEAKASEQKDKSQNAESAETTDKTMSKAPEKTSNNTAKTVKTAAKGTEQKPSENNEEQK